jgi:Ca-activated chloride channel family protein
MERPMKHIAGLALALLAAPALAAENVILVLDASGSMWGRIGDRSKVEIAREAVGSLVADWNPANPIGLVAYGHRRKGDCNDIETLIPLGPLDRAKFTGTVNRLNALGMTPLSAAVVQAADALRIQERKSTVILVSDGEETCNLDPCKVGAELEARGVDFTAHVIGFDVPDPKHQAQLRCLAEATGGRYLNARDARSLTAALGTLATASTRPALPPAEASVQGPAQAPVASDIRVAWTGPADDGDYVAIARVEDRGATEYDFANLGKDTPPVSLATPATPGAYELRYVSPRRTPAVLARAPITILEATATLEAPDAVMATAQLTVKATGPEGARHWIGFAPKGSPATAYLDYERPTGAASEVVLTAPAEAGEYELRYVLNESERVLASRPIRVTPAGATLEAPDEVMAGARIKVRASGPDDPAHWIGFAPAGSPPASYLDYARPTGPVSEVELQAPVKPGTYELRYVLNESEKIAASRTVRVVDAQASIEAPASVRAGERITVTARGPEGGSHWIGFAPAGSPPSAFRDYQRPTGPTSVVELTAPDEPGDYEIRYVLNESERVLVSRPIKVLAP